MYLDKVTFQHRAWYPPHHVPVDIYLVNLSEGYFEKVKSIDFITAFNKLELNMEEQFVCWTIEQARELVEEIQKSQKGSE